MTEITAKSVTSLAELIRSLELSPVEIVQAYLDRIADLNPKLNAIVTLAPDAMDKAKAAEASVMRGDALGPLHGIPLTVKDTIETAGLRTTSGSVLRADYVPERDADAVARLKGAGAIILGKTNTAEMAMDYTTDNPVFGRAINPHNPLLTTGGSSGGEAAAIASFISPGGIGSDLAGSIRIPSHFCGIAGLKPTVGRVPGDGQFPPNTGPYSLGAVIGPMARSVDDLRVLFRALAGIKNSSGDPDLAHPLSGARVSWYADDGVSPVTVETRQAVETAAKILARSGLIVAETRPPGIERGHEMWLTLFSRASVVQLRNVYSGHEEKAGNFVRWRLATAENEPPPALDDYITSWMARDRVRAQLVEWMAQSPLILAPVGATPAIANEALKVTVGEQTVNVFRAFSYAQTFNVFDLPVAVVPVGRSAEGLPIGVQIIGRPFEEETVLAAAAIIEEAVGQE
ncbi:MAG TPA: amidase [Pyrinomonadaceae bacterium]|nr:amidase [Pyrinomonadaceae bacterium]